MIVTVSKGSVVLISVLLLVGFLHAGQDVNTDQTIMANRANSMCETPDDWTRNAAIQHYFRGPYFDFELHSGVFVDRTENYDKFIEYSDDERIRILTGRHERALGIIQRMGRLLPYLSSPEHLPALISQLEKNEISLPSANLPPEFLRVSLLRDMIASREGADADIINFLKDMMEFEQGLADVVSGDITLEQATALNALVPRTATSRKAFKDNARAVIFSDDLHDRMSARLLEYCNNVATQK